MKTGKWSKEEEQLLIENVIKLSMKELIILLDRSDGSIKNRKTKLGITNKKSIRTHYAFLQAVKQIHPTIEVMSEYQGYYKDIYFKCSICNHEWEQKPYDFLHNKGCSSCLKGNRRENNLIQKWDNIKSIVENKGYSLLNIQYIDKGNGNNSVIFIDVQDKIGYKYFITYNDFKTNSFFYHVRNNNPYSIENIKLWLHINNKNFILLDNVYISAKDLMKFYCNECLQEFYSTWEMISICDCECNICNNSKGERKIKDILLNNNILHEQQFVFINCKYKKSLRFDFYLPDLNICIEYQGIQHYKPIDFASKGIEWAKEQFELTKIKDQIKLNYCKNNNIQLIRIPYWEFDNIEKILERELNLQYNIK